MRVSRKLDHVRHALQLGQSGHNGLNDVRLVHNCLPNIAMENVLLNTAIGDLNLSSPIIINAMTGGAEETEWINRELAIVARECGLTIAVGSQMAAIKDPSVGSSYSIVRTVHSQGTIVANLGSEATVDMANRAIELIQANALQIHLNPMQELIMSEGDRTFAGMIDRLQRIVDAVHVPVIVKEVGFGIMGDSARKLRKIGVSYVDVGGSGGTNFASIENARRMKPLEWLNNWGATTCISLLETLVYYPQGTVIASGGISTGLDICKALSLGASATGIAGTFLRILHQEGTTALTEYVNQLHQDLRLLMTALGARTIEELWLCPIVIGGETAAWCETRGIDFAQYARRKGIE